MNKREDIQGVLQRIEQIQKELKGLYLQVEKWGKGEDADSTHYFETKQEYDLEDFEEAPRKPLAPCGATDFLSKPEGNVAPESSVLNSSYVGHTSYQVKKPLTDYISVIDHFRFKRELFGDDSQEMARVLEEIARLDTERDMRSYLVEVLHWDEKRVEVRDFFDRLRPYFL